jgi:hypothetical protein
MGPTSKGLRNVAHSSLSLADQRRASSWHCVVRPTAVALDAAATPSHTGHSFPLGATVLPGGVNFSVFSRQATRVAL